MIEPRRDAYGPEADTSNLADYLELLALAGTPLRRAELADYLAEQRWVVRSRELFHDPNVDRGEPREDKQEGGAGPSPAEVAAGNVFELLAMRATTLRDLYPFELDGRGLVARHPADDQQRGYLCLLAITVAHHYEVETDPVPERVFEGVVADVMGARGLSTIDTGAAGRRGGDFRDLVREIGQELGLVAAPEAAPSRTKANEEGVDTVSHLGWGDVRAGHWVFIGQATIARSNEWARKIEEPKPAQWGPLLTCVVRPVPYLAVPHHVEDAHFQNVSVRAEKLILDRLRLARHLGDLSDEQQSVLDSVAKESVYHPLR